MSKMRLVLMLLLISRLSWAGMIELEADGSGDAPTVQEAVEMATSGDILVLSPGIYTGSGNVDVVIAHKTLTLRSTDPNDPNIVASTIIDCNGSSNEPHRAFDIQGHTVNVTLGGLTLVNGHGRITGGAIKCLGQSTLKNCMIRNCSAGLGGAIFCCSQWEGESDPVAILTPLRLIGCTLTDNRAYEGGAIYLGANRLELEQCTLQANRSTRHGGALAGAIGQIQMNNVTLLANQAQYGGGLSSYACDVAMEDSILVGNRATRHGAGVYHQDSTSSEIAPSLTLDRCSITANQAQAEAGGVYVKDVVIESISSPLYRFRDCILWANQDQSGSSLASQLSGPNLDVAFCCLQDTAPLDGNVPYPDNSNQDTDPLWQRHPSDGNDGWGDDPNTTELDESANDDFGDLHLTAASPCIDAGQSDLWIPVTSVDLDGQPRGLVGIVDIGADEYSSTAYRVIAPQPDTLIAAGSQIPLAWEGPIDENDLCIAYSLDLGLTWETITTEPPGSGTLSWQTPSVAAILSAVVRVMPCSGPESQAAYSGFFTLYPEPTHTLASPWSTLGGSFQRTSQSPLQGPVIGCIAWTFATSSVICNSVALGPDGQIYVPTLNGQLHSLNAQGHPLWTYRTGAMITSAPTVDDDGTISIGCEDGTLHMISSQGQCQRVFTLGGSPVSSIVILPDQRRVVGTGSGGVVIISPDGLNQQILDFDLGYTSPSMSSDGTVYWIDQDLGLMHYDWITGLLQWNTTFLNPWHGSFCYPVVTGDKVILGVLNDPNLYAFDASNGQHLWAVDLTCNSGYENWSEPAVGPDGTLYASLNDSYLQAVSPIGQRLWATPLGVSQGYTLCIDPDGTIYAAGDDGLLYVLNTAGTVIARFDAGTPLSYPVITADHTLLVSGVEGQGLTNASGLLYAINAYVTCGPLDLAPVTETTD